MEKRTVDYLIEISGVDQFEKPKAHIALTHSLRFSDGSTMTQQELNIHLKPIVSVFKHAGFVNVYLDFLSRDDNDLAMVWNLLSEYSQPQNSVDWTIDELESGFYEGEDGNRHMIYFPMIELVLSPNGKETEYLIHAFNPAFYTLEPNSPKGDPCVLQLTFPEDWLVVNDTLDPVDMESLRNEVMEEMGMDLGAGMDPKDFKEIPSYGHKR